VAWVPQHPHLLTAPVADNLRLARADADTTELWAALAAVGLDDVVRALPRGLDTPLGEGGAGLSAGQRQRVAVARAVVSRAPLVLLDEPTAELDATSAARVATTVAGLAGDRTVVVATHDPVLVGRADRVVELAPAPVVVA
jgi:ABC-type transport system involved in cytochrome bd biosynthesis fused ATPase/permease subunit